MNNMAFGTMLKLNICFKLNPRSRLRKKKTKFANNLISIYHIWILKVLGLPLEETQPT